MHRLRFLLFIIISLTATSKASGNTAFIGTRISAPYEAFVGESTPFTGYYNQSISPSTGEEFYFTGATATVSSTINFGDGTSGILPQKTLTGTASSQVTTYHTYTNEGSFYYDSIFNVNWNINTNDGSSFNEQPIHYGSGSISIYSPETTKEVLNTVISNAEINLAKMGVTNPTKLEILKQAAQEALLYRQTNAETSASPAARDAEYLLMSYVGAQLLKNPSAITEGDTTFLLSNPVTATMYNAWKITASFFGGSTQVSNLPGSQPGGIAASAQGFWLGLKDAEISEITGTSYASNINAESSNIEAPINPKATLGNTSLFEFNTQPSSVYFLDPTSSTSYLYGVAGNTFSSILIPNLPNLTNNTFNISFGGNNYQILAGTKFNFLDYTEDGVNAFGLTGLNMLDNTDFIAEFEFGNTGRTFVTQTRNDTAPVPEPSSFLLLGAGILTFTVGLARRKMKF